MIKERIYLFIIITIFVAVGITSAQVILATWTEPPYPPTGGNVEPPVNKGANAQTKRGELLVGVAPHGNTYGLTVENGMAYFEGGLKLDILGADPTGADLTEGRIWIRN